MIPNGSTSHFERNAAVLVLAAIAIVFTVRVSAQSPEQTSFSTPEAAATALVSAVKAGQTDRVYTILGPELKDALSGRDPQLAKFERELFLMAAAQEVKVEREKSNADRAIAYFGKQEWPFPAPLVLKSGKWMFDSAAGREEIEDRLIGRQELQAIGACLAYGYAQIDYFSVDRNGDGVLQFAQKLISTPGKMDGLYWNNDRDQPLSPLGPFFAPTEASAQSLHGYTFKILTRQGADAVGGARDYIVDGRMVLGFALVAWPVDYGHGGISTFIVNQLGQVYEKDLGPQTAEAARTMVEFNPDSSWKKVSPDDENDDDDDSN
jgi:hypothetical protein